MNDWQEKLGARGKAIIGLAVLPILVPAVAISFHAVHLWANTDQLNPSLEGYHRLMEEANEALASLEDRLQDEASAPDWQAAMEKTRHPDVEDERNRQTVNEVAKPRPQPVMLGDLELQGIFWKAGRPIVYVNHELVELHEKVNGWKVTHIGKNTMVVADPEGNEETYNLDAILKRLYPGYRQP